MSKSPVIALDAGHGMKTAGKRCLQSLDPNETREWWLNDRIADKTETLLTAYDCRVVRVDDTTGERDVSLSGRVRTANAAKADIYLSIHHNAGLSGRSGGGTTVYYSAEESARKMQAQKLYDTLVGRTGLWGNRSQKVIRKGFYVIRNTTMPAFLIENGFMDSSDDVPIILSEEHAVRTAEGVTAFLREMLQLKAKILQDGSVPTEPALGDGLAGENGWVESGPSGNGTGLWRDDSVCYPAYRGKKTTLTAAMTSLGINSSYANRRQIAEVNHILSYRGTAAQNIQMYNMLTAGVLKRV